MITSQELSAVETEKQPWKTWLSSPIRDPGTLLQEVLTSLTEADEAASVLEELQALAARDGRSLELAAAYAEAAQAPAGALKELAPVQRLEAYLQAAWVCSEHEGYEAATLHAALAALDISAADERALALAESLLLGAEQYAELANRYAQASLAALTEERARQLLERGLHLLSPLLGAAPALVGLNERLARLSALRRSSFPPPAADSALIEAELRRALESEDAATRRESRARLGELLIAHGRAAEGVALWLPELSQLGDAADLDLLERLCEQAEDYEGLERVLVCRAELAGDPEDRARALERLGVFYRERGADAERATGAFMAAGDRYATLGALDDAERVYELLLDGEPGHVNAAEKLSILRAKIGDFKRVAEAFGVVMRDSEDGKRAATLLLEIEPDAARVGAADEFAELVEGLLWRLSTGDGEYAERLLRSSARLFAEAVRHDEAAEVYRRLISEHGRQKDARAFELVIESHPASDWRRRERRWLFEWLEAQAEDKSAVLLAWADVEEREWGDPSAALLVLERAMALDSAEPELWRSLARLRLSSGNVEAGLSAIERLRELGAEPGAELLARVVEQRPATRWALDRLKLIFSAEQRFSELLELYDRALEVTVDAAERASLLDEAAIAARDVAGDNQSAIRYWQRYLALLPHEARVDHALERLYERGGLTQELISHLARRAELTEGVARVALLRRVVELALGSAEFGEARRVLERMLETDAVAACEYMERILACPADAAVRGWALDSLKAHYRANERAAELARLLRLELSDELASEERVQRLTELGRLCEKNLADVAGAFDAQLELFRLKPGQERERKRLEKLTRRLGRFQELCDAYLEIAATSDVRELADALLSRAYQLARETLNDPERAIAIARKILARFAGRSSPEQRALHLELVALLEGVGALEAAQSELSLLARYYPTDADVLFRCARAAAAAGAWAEAERSFRALLLILHGGAGQAPELSRSAVYVEISQIRRQCGDEAAARELLDFAFEAALVSESEARGLELALRQSGRLELLERACFERLARAESPSAIAPVLAELVGFGPDHSLSLETRAAAERGAERVAAALEAASLDEALIAAMPEALAGCVHLAPAARARGLMLRHQESVPEPMRETLRLALSTRLLSVPEHRAEALSQLELPARRGELAKGTWALLASAWEATGETEKLRFAVERWLEQEPESSAALCKALELALAAEELARAGELYAQLAQLASPAPGKISSELRRQLQQAYARAGDDEHAAELLLSQLPELKDDARRAAVLAEAGELLRRAGRASEALSAAEQAAALDPRSPEAALLLAQLARERGDHAHALSLLSELAEAKERRRGKALARALRLLADIQLERDQLAEALPHLIEAHQLDKSDLDTALVLGLLAMDLDRSELAASALRVIIAQREHGVWPSALAKSQALHQTCLQLARIELQQGRKTGAKRMALRALEEDPASVPAQRLLDALNAS